MNHSPDADDGDAIEPQQNGHHSAAELNLTAVAGPTLAFLALYACVFAIVAYPPARTELWLAISACLALTLALLSVIDLRTFRLPDALTLPLAVAGLTIPWLVDGDITVTERALAGIGAYAALALINRAYLKLRGQHGLGLGDAKLFGAAGTWVGALSLCYVLLWASLAALLAYAIHAVRRGGGDRFERIAFGPFLAFGFWLVWITA